MQELGSVKRDEVASYLGYLLRRARIAAAQLGAESTDSGAFAALAGATPAVPSSSGPAESLEAEGGYLRYLAILVVIIKHGPVSQQWLAEYLKINRSVMVKLIDVLERRGDVVRARNSADRRSYALAVTVPGRRRAKALSAQARRLSRELVAPLSAAEVRRLVGLLGELVGPRFSPELPRTLLESPVWLVTIAHEHMEAGGDERLEPLGLSVRTYVSLALLSGMACSQTELATHMLIGPAATVDLVDELERRGAVHRVRNVADRRSYNLEVTPEGQRLQVLGRDVIAASTAEFTKSLDREANEELLGLLGKLTSADSKTAS
ncbi:MAG: MarR family winged helix-turn-helix transcriptional regulator [Acidimicrobiales bacterium]